MSAWEHDLLEPLSAPIGLCSPLAQVESVTVAVVGKDMPLTTLPNAALESAIQALKVNHAA